MKLNSFKRNILSEEITENLRTLILQNKLKPGDKLPNEIDLSKQMGVSRSTIREAIKVLASSNIVHVIRGKGTYISEQPGLVTDPLGVNFINDKNLLLSLFEVRLIVEPMVAFLAAERANKTDLKRIKDSIIQMHQAIAANLPYENEDLEFHRSIAEATKNPIIQRIVPIINDSIVQGYYKTAHVPGSANKAVESHLHIFQAIKAKSPELARDAMKEHLKRVLSEIEGNVE